MNLRFYQCEICGKVIAILSNTGTPTVCCGRNMQELIPNRTDGSFEKHVPVYRPDGNTIWVRIGSEPHPMTDAHSISWVGLQTDQGFQFKELLPGDAPRACFSICPEDRAGTVFALCSVHGLWSSDEGGMSHE